MDEELRDSLMEWYLRYGGRGVDVSGIIATKEWVGLRAAWPSQYIIPTRNALDEYKLGAAYYSKYIKGDGYNTGGTNFKITPEGIEALKNG